MPAISRHRSPVSASLHAETPKSPAVCEGAIYFCAAGLDPPFSPVPGARLPSRLPVTSRQALDEPLESMLPLVRAARLDPGLGRDHRDDAGSLRLRCQPVRIEAVGRPRKIIVHAVEAEAQKVLDLFRFAPIRPSRGACRRW